ncbi:GNAT family N-acetyltransferase [Agarivorans sp. MS3-6]|uniref:GNAT family N-acetyltransferase n=1 Tax=Agarivorans sp. TSD2052 TaxID=2937286 RepID=UPI00200F986F|nr:N-acetyltransferase [Agarivorans sp. TSD2052]UPW20355.1 N-acetyltransferase [Agarivorans sp. TSD2052]
MKLTTFNPEFTDELIVFFSQVFSDAANQAEGKLIGDLVAKLITTTAPQDIVGYLAIDDGMIVGSIFFSRMSLSNQQHAFILSPVAIATKHQGKGIGQQLIKFGIEQLKSIGVELLFTYGDPNFYSKLGFKQISETLIKAPLILSYPEGWLAQTLNGKSMTAIDGETQCVKALMDQQYW